MLTKIFLGFTSSRSGPYARSCLPRDRQAEPYLPFPASFATVRVPLLLPRWADALPSCPSLLCWSLEGWITGWCRASSRSESEEVRLDRIPSSTPGTPRPALVEAWERRDHHHLHRRVGLPRTSVRTGPVRCRRPCRGLRD